MIRAQGLYNSISNSDGLWLHQRTPSGHESDGRTEGDKDTGRAVSIARRAHEFCSCTGQNNHAYLLKRHSTCSMTTSKKSLKAGRPPTAQKAKRSLSSQVTRTIIRSHHQLHHKLSNAVKKGDEAEINRLKHEIQEQGGLKTYQDASITGQSSERGGDSSKVLMTWLKDLKLSSNTSQPLAMLEVGALSTQNACSRSKMFNMTWIDLNSQDPRIEQQDFMERPLPVSTAERFDVLSLSLVLNYVPEASARGDMLRRTTQFMKKTPGQQLPLLFLVLPAPCVTNSRYLDQKRLEDIMASLGYHLIKVKVSSKLFYSLWRLAEPVVEAGKVFAKTEINPGRQRNNFCVILR